MQEWVKHEAETQYKTTGLVDPRVWDLLGKQTHTLRFLERGTGNKTGRIVAGGMVSWVHQYSRLGRGRFRVTDRTGYLDVAYGRDLPEFFFLQIALGVVGYFLVRYDAEWHRWYLKKVHVITRLKLPKREKV